MDDHTRRVLDSIRARLDEGRTMDPEKVYPFEDDSAWGGDGELAWLCGLLNAALHSARERLGVVEITMPQGYAPVIELRRVGGRRFRLRVEAVQEQQP